MKSDFLVALKQLAAERNLPQESVLSAIEAALASDRHDLDRNTLGQLPYFRRKALFVQNHTHLARCLQSGLENELSRGAISGLPAK